MAERSTVSAPLKMEESVRQAFSALARGHANAAQQRGAINYLITHLCLSLTSQPASLNEREAGFVSGRQWVGLQVAEAAKLQLLEAKTIE